MKISKTMEFSAGHHLPGHPHCGKAHGHNYIYTVTVEGQIDKHMVMDYIVLKDVMRESLKGIDHCDLNETLKYPTAEDLVDLLAFKLQSLLPLGVKLSRIDLWETRDSCAIWESQ